MTSAQTTEHWYYHLGHRRHGRRRGQGRRRSWATPSPTAGARRRTATIAGRTILAAAPAGQRRDREGRGHEPGHRRQRGRERGLGHGGVRPASAGTCSGRAACGTSIVFDGVNDIGGGASARVDEGRLRQHDQRRRTRKGLLIYGATITPFGGNTLLQRRARERPPGRSTRTSRAACSTASSTSTPRSRDGGNPPKLQATYDSGDGLHLSPAGYQKMADTVDLTLFTR